MNFFDDGPVRRSSLAKQPVDKLDGPVSGSRPTAFEKPRIVKNSDAARFHETAPIVPIILNPCLGMVATNFDQFQRFLPALGHVVTELSDPYHLAASAGLHDL